MKHPKKMMRQRMSIALVCATAVCGFAHAQLPSNPQAMLIVPFPAGSAYDNAARQIQPELGRLLGKTVIVENYGGAGGSIAAQRLLSADATRLQMLVGSPSELTLPPLTQAGIKYKPSDFRLLAQLTQGPLAVLARNDLPAKSLEELIASKKQPGATPISIANIGHGSNIHLAAADLAKRTNVPITHVPYKGGAPIMQDLMGRQVDLALLPLIPSYVQAAQEKKIKVLAVLAPKRHTAVPDAPTVDEVPGLHGLYYAMWTGLYVPQKLPIPTAEAINKAANEIVASPAFRSWVEARGSTPGAVMNLPQAAAFDKAESERYTKVAAEVGLERE